jgi:hypothetical protein
MKAFFSTIYYKSFFAGLLLAGLASTLPQTDLTAAYDVKQFGAIGDGITMDTKSIQAAIDKAHDDGGGIVEIPAGTYKIGTLILRDNVNLHLQPGSIVQGSPDYRDYLEIVQKFESRTNGLYAKYFMIFAEGARNISITGTGVIHGNGAENFRETRPQNLRPFMIRLVDCSNITIRDVYLLESANWTLHLLGCRDVNVEGIVIENTGEGNRDGIDIDACRRVTVSNSRFSTTDDAIVMKSSCDVLCQDIAITNCQVRSEASAIKTGTESNGGFKNITISNCVIRDIPVHAGIELMTVDGGIMQNILLENLTMENVATPVFIRLGQRARPYKRGQYVGKIDDVKDIQLNNISVLNAILPSSIMGLHHKKIRNVSISNYTVRYSETQSAIPYNRVPFEEFSYPAANVFKYLPAYGLYCRNAEELHLSNIAMYSLENEVRPALTFDRVNDLELISVRAEVKQPSRSMIHFRNCRGVLATYCSATGESSSLFELEKDNCVDFRYDGNLIKQGQQETSEVQAPGKDPSFYDFQTDIKYSVDQGMEVNGMPAHDLNAGPLDVPLEITGRGSLQLCLLTLNDSAKPGKLVIEYEGIRQEFLVDWHEWGWAPVTLLREFDPGRKVVFRISAGTPGSRLQISRACLRHQDIGFTD